MSYQHRNNAYYDEGDVDKIVDSSYGFLSDMHGGDTLPRKTNVTPVNVVSWNDRNRHSSPPREKPRVRYWEPRFKSVRDIPQEQLPPSRRQRNDFNASHHPRIYAQPKPNYAQQNQPRVNNNEYTQNVQKVRQDYRYEEPKYVPSKAQFVPPPKAPEMWKKSPSTESNLLQYTKNANPKSKVEVSGWEHYSNSKNTAPEPVYNADSGDSKGSFLLQRTNYYLEAAGKMNNKSNKEEHVPQRQPIEINKKRLTTFSPEIPPHKISDNIDNIEKSEKRKSIAERIEDLSRSTGPPPPPLPPLDLQTSSKQPERPQLSYLSQLQNGRQTLRSVKRIMDAPEQTNQPEPKNLREKLNRLLQLQIDSRNRNYPQTVVEEDSKNIKAYDKYNTIKTLSKAAMKDKLEIILQDGPPKKPSFRGVNDLLERREAINKLRSIESKAVDDTRESTENIRWRQTSNENETNRSSFVRRHPSNGADVCQACGSKKIRAPTNDVTERQKVLMENVFATIKLKGRMSNDSQL